MHKQLFIGCCILHYIPYSQPGNRPPNQCRCALLHQTGPGTDHIYASTTAAQVPWNLADFGYFETEYFMQDRVNIYDYKDGRTDQPGPYPGLVSIRGPRAMRTHCRTQARCR